MFDQAKYRTGTIPRTYFAREVRHTVSLSLAPSGQHGRPRLLHAPGPWGLGRRPHMARGSNPGQHAPPRSIHTRISPVALTIGIGRSEVVRALATVGKSNCRTSPNSAVDCACTPRFPPVGRKDSRLPSCSTRSRR